MSSLYKACGDMLIAQQTGSADVAEEE